MANGTSKRSELRRTFYVSSLLALITVLLYCRTISYEFIVVDDHKYVYQNAMVLKGISWAGIKWAFTTVHASNWHPLTWISHMLDVSLYGLFAGGHHATSVALHIANMILLLLVLKQLTGAFWPSALVAALFGWHPAHVESVAWVCERKDILSMFFMVLTIWAYGRYALQRTTGKYLAALALFALGLMSKPMLVTLPCVLLLLDYWPLNRFTFSPTGPGTPPSKTGWPTLIIEKLPFFLLSLLSAAITVIAQHKGGAIQTLDHVSFSSRAINAICAYGAYLEKAVWPLHLSVFYPMPATIPWGLFIGSAAVLVSVSYLVFRQRFIAPWLIVGWLWFLGTLVPVIGLVQVGNQAMGRPLHLHPLHRLIHHAGVERGTLAQKITGHEALNCRNTFRCRARLCRFVRDSTELLARQHPPLHPCHRHYGQQCVLRTQFELRPLGVWTRKGSDTALSGVAAIDS